MELDTCFIVRFGGKGSNSIACHIENGSIIRSLPIKPLINVARNLNVPVLLHTGEFKECRAAVFEPLIKSNTDIDFGQPEFRSLLVSDSFGRVTH